ncbi:hypothetical protein PR048_020719 [Dryococelus australis]|uniref:Uncharacterized protein n=1 Tax=Dryococelus australis TaxID=614101 RepID=A0ABQ9H728_9NEOP|nr:hypothetical protein PR048_020719 [Dryococelus australis]
MLLLKERIPEVHDAFENGAFVACKTERSFSVIALDHAHEQQNSALKSDGGIVGLTHNIEALRRFMVAGPEVALIEQFSKHVDAIVLAVEIVGNPFGVTNGDLHRLHDYVVMSDNVAASIMVIEKEGQEQFLEFVMK